VWKQILRLSSVNKHAWHRISPQHEGRECTCTCTPTFRTHAHSCAHAPALACLKAHHLAREVFLTQQRDANSIESILRLAHVLPLRDFCSGAACSRLGEDVFACDYLYDSAWQVEGVPERCPEGHPGGFIGRGCDCVHVPGVVQPSR